MWDFSSPCGILVPQAGSKPASLALEGGFQPLNYQRAPKCLSYRGLWIQVCITWNCESGVLRCQMDSPNEKHFKENKTSNCSDSCLQAIFRNYSWTSNWEEFLWEIWPSIFSQDLVFTWKIWHAISFIFLLSSLKSVSTDPAKLKKLQQSGEAFVQDDSCVNRRGTASKCRECRLDSSSMMKGAAERLACVLAAFTSGGEACGENRGTLSPLMYFSPSFCQQ